MKYLATDLGNVICDVNFDLFKKEASSFLGASLEDIDRFLNETQKIHDLGLMSTSDQLRNHFNINDVFIINKLMAEWNRTVKANSVMMSFLIELLRSGNVKIALLSNIGEDHAAIMKNVLTNDVFDNSVKFFSCQVGARKPTYLYYKMFLDMNPEFNGCVYLDDRIENIEAGTKFGFNSQHFALDGFNSQSELEQKILSIKKLI